jgi:hypothetical protein
MIMVSESRERNGNGILNVHIDKAQNDEDDDMDMIKSKYITLQSQIATLRNENKTIRRENKTIFMRYDKAKKERNSELNKQKATNSTLKMEIIDKDNMITSLRQRIAELLTRRENREEMELIHQQNQEIQTRFEQMELMIEQLTERVKETNTEDAVSELDEYSSDEQEYNSSYYDTENDPDEVASESEEEGEVSC